MVGPMSGGDEVAYENDEVAVTLRASGPMTGEFSRPGPMSMETGGQRP